MFKCPFRLIRERLRGRAYRLFQHRHKLFRVLCFIDGAGKSADLPGTIIKARAELCDANRLANLCMPEGCSLRRSRATDATGENRLITLLTFDQGKAAFRDASAETALPAGALWIDMLDSGADEVRLVEEMTGQSLPTLEDLSEIESSSRVSFRNGALQLSAPLVFRDPQGELMTTPCGFVLTPERLITIRFQALPAFDSFKATVEKEGVDYTGSAILFTGLLETIVDRLADNLERVGAELDAVSRRIFRKQTGDARQIRKPKRENADLRVILSRVGGSGDFASRMRDSLLGLARIVPYAMNLGANWIPQDVLQRLDTLRHDVLSLSDYEMHLSNKVQLLLDATLGLINVEQNNVFKVLTIVSVVGIPPTLVASMYGMNFRHMPELDWAWGYPYGLGLIAISTIIPILWFKIRGWF